MEMDKAWIDTLTGARDILNHPDVKKLNFAIPSTNYTRAIDARIPNQSQIDENDRLIKSAQSSLNAVLEMVDNYNNAETEEEAEEAYNIINEDPLEIKVGISGYFNAGQTEEPDEFMILLGTGGPAFRLIGELDECCQPEKCRFQYQDWFIPWKDLQIDEKQQEKLLQYCRFFYFGD